MSEDTDGVEPGQEDAEGPGAIGDDSRSQGKAEDVLLGILASSAPRAATTNIAMVAFVIPLSFALGIPHHSTFMLMGNDELDALADREWFVTEDGPQLPDFGGRVGVSLRVWRPRKEEVLANSLLRDMDLVFSTLYSHDGDRRIQLPASEDTAGTVLEASTVLYLRDDTENASAALSRTFDYCLSSIGLLLRALRITLGDPRILPVGRLSTPPVIPYIVRYGDNLDKRYAGLFCVNIGESLPILRSQEVPDEEVFIALDRVQRAMYNFPVFAAEDAHARAKRSFFIESDYAATTVFAYTAIEVFCNGLLSLLSWEGGVPRAENAHLLSTQGLESRLRNHYAPHLGGNWDYKSSASPIHILDSVATVRHRYLHAGVEPSIDEADLALEAFSVVTEFAKDRLVAKLYEFPRTALLILGEPGLRRNNAWTRRFQRLLGDIVNENFWLRSFSDWMSGSSPQS